MISLKKMLIITSSFFFILLVNGAIPTVTMPTLGQALWTIGFGQSYANQDLLTVYANNFGYPAPAAISFGLSGAYVTGIFIKLGVSNLVAYSAMVAFWLFIAYVGTWKVSRYFRISFGNSAGISTVWLTLPIIWQHASYSMLSLGIALLPFYIWTALKLFDSKQASKKTYALYLLATVISVFMDGYTFMMFAVGASLILLFQYIDNVEQRNFILYKKLPYHFVCFAISYVLFALFIGKTSYSGAGLDFFRGWGNDLFYILLPTKGLLYIWDYLGVSVARSDSELFGDFSVWTTTFALPILLLALFSYFTFRKKVKLTRTFILITLFGFYMSLGPSFKVNVTKPIGVTGRGLSQSLAPIPTGTGLISKALPGFNNMRASYRWAALGFLGCWLLLVIFISRSPYKKASTIILLLLIVSNVPNLEDKFDRDKNHIKQAKQIDVHVLSSLEKNLKEGEKVAFLPFRNDFLVNYLAARLSIHAYNIGGDKNLAEAREHWPEYMKDFSMNSVDEFFKQRLLLLLASDKTDVVVLPYIDFLHAAHVWPPQHSFKQQMLKIVDEISKNEFITVSNYEYYSLIRVKPDSETTNNKKDMITGICMPLNCFDD